MNGQPEIRSKIMKQDERQMSIVTGNGPELSKTKNYHKFFTVFRKSMNTIKTSPSVHPHYS